MIKTKRKKLIKCISINEITALQVKYVADEYSTTESNILEWAFEYYMASMIHTPKEHPGHINEFKMNLYVNQNKEKKWD